MVRYLQSKIRFYNGPQSALMDDIYDRLIEHIDVGELDDWPIISLHLARVIRKIPVVFEIRKSDLNYGAGKDDPY